MSKGDLLSAKIAEAERILNDAGYDQEVADLRRDTHGESWFLLVEELELMFRIGCSRNDLGFVLRKRPSHITA